MSEIINVIGSKVAETTTTQEQELGFIAVDSDGTKRQYVQADGALVANEFVIINKDNQCAKLTLTLAAAGLGKKVGISEIAFADDEYGFVVVEGQTTGKVAANCAANALLYTTATAGVLDDATSTGLTLIHDVVALTAVVTAGTTDIRIGSSFCSTVTS